MATRGKRSSDPSVFKESGWRFLNSSSPCALLVATGCIPIAVNSAYVEVPRRGRHFQPPSDVPVVCDINDYLKIVAETLRRLPYFARLEESAIAGAKAPHGDQSFPRELRCFCEFESAILALRSEDCTYEISFAALQASESAVDAGFEFNLTSQAGDDEERQYQLVMAHTEILGDVCANGGRAKGLLQVRLVTSEHASLYVKGIPADGVLNARVAVNGSSQTPIEWFPASAFQVDRTKLVEYNLMDECLEAAEANPTEANIESCLREALRRILQESPQTYAAYRTMVEGLHEVLHSRPTEYGKGVSDLRARLYDAPVVASSLRGRLMASLGSPEFEDLMASLTLEQRADLKYLRTPIDRLQMADSFESVFLGG